MVTERSSFGEREPRARRLGLVPFFETLVRHRKPILVLAFGAAFVAGVIALIAPVTYETTMTILPPEPVSPLGVSAAGLQSNLALLQMRLASVGPSDLYADMLKSRSVRRYVIDKLNLLEVFGLSKRDTLHAYSNALGILDQDILVSTANNGLITVTLQAHTSFFASKEDRRQAQHRVAAIGRALAEGLETIHRNKNTSRARQARLYLEQQVEQTDQNLDRATRDLASFQSAHLAIDLSEQMRVGIETAGKLQGELLAREVALGVALQSMRPENPEVRRLQSEIQEIRRQLRALEEGRGNTGSEAGRQNGLQAGGEDAARDHRGLGLEQMPELGRLYAEKLREAKIQETVYEMLTQQLYQARIQETQDVPVIQVLDEAAVPAYKKGPVVRRAALLAGVLGLASGVLFAFGREWWQRYPGRRADEASIRRLLKLRVP